MGQVEGWEEGVGGRWKGGREAGRMEEGDGSWKWIIVREVRAGEKKWEGNEREGRVADMRGGRKVRHMEEGKEKKKHRLKEGVEVKE